MDPKEFKEYITNCRYIGREEWKNLIINWEIDKKNGFFKIIWYYYSLCDG